jgi:hypothetical protein
MLVGLSFLDSSFPFFVLSHFIPKKKYINLYGTSKFFKAKRHYTDYHYRLYDEKFLIFIRHFQITTLEKCGIVILVDFHVIKALKSSC